MDFNPFEDRFSRDLRNDLSSELSAAIAHGDISSLAAKVKFYQESGLDPCYRKYLDDRWDRFQKAFSVIHPDITDPIAQGVVLWNNELFFEMHEVLEHAWMEATGTDKLLLQAMIRAAGAYIKKEFGYRDAASRLAAKAVIVLREHGEILAPYFVVEDLINALAANADIPPILRQAP
jgi:hypothetical protein